MLDTLGTLITTKPWTIVLFVVAITLGFSVVLPSLEMETSMEDFLPDDEVVLAQERINEYFSAGNNVIMILAESSTQDASVVSVSSLREIYTLSQELESREDVTDVVSIAGFVNMVCNLEYNQSIANCTDEQVQSAYDDLMREPPTSSVQMMQTDDPNEAVEYQRFNIFSRKIQADSLDVKNLFIKQDNKTLYFTLELYDLVPFDQLLMSQGLRVNVIEWYVNFQNMIGPTDLQQMDYQITAHVEPTEELWQLGRGLLGNINHVILSMRNQSLRRSFSTTLYLWLTPPGQPQGFPIPLNQGNITWYTDHDQLILSVDKQELQEYGIAIEDTSFGLPARLGNITAGVRSFQLPLLNIPWLRVSYNMDFLANTLGFVQNRPLIGSIGGHILEKQAGMSWDDINELVNMMQESLSDQEALTLTQMEQYYHIIDQAPDTGSMVESIYIKPQFLTNMKESVINFLSQDFSVDTGAQKTLLLVNFNATLSLDDVQESSREIVTLLQEREDTSDSVRFQATGDAIVEYEITDVSMEANQIIVPIIFLVISIILFVSFRKLSYVILPLIGLTFAIIWLFGTMVLLGMEFMVMEVALIPMIMGLGVDYSVHLYHNYRVERGQGHPPDQAMQMSIRDIGIAMLLATITTFIAFLSFLTASMIPLRDFGVLCAIGIAYVFIITMTFQAAFRYILDRRKQNNSKTKKKDETKQYGRVMRKIARVVCTHPHIILLITIGITVLMVFGATQIKTGFSMEDFLPEENPSVVVLNQVLNEFPFASQSKEYILIEGDVATVSTIKAIQQTMRNTEDDDFILRTREGDTKVLSILTIMQQAMDENTSLIDAFNLNTQAIPTSDANVDAYLRYLYDHETYGYDIQQYLNKEENSFDATVIHIYTDTLAQDNDVSSVMKALYEGIQDDISRDFEDVEVTVTGENSQMHVIMTSMTESQIISTLICLLLAAIVLSIAYKNPVLGLITMIPVSVSTIWIVGAMYFIGYSLNVMTIMITSLTIGLGITYAIHAVERFRLVAEHTGDVISAVSETIGHTGGALLISAVTTMLGFGMLALTPMPVEQQFGLITALTILFALITSIFILPPVLLLSLIHI